MQAEPQYPVVAFGEFSLDRHNRSLRRDGEAIELGSRYFDALLLLIDNPARLVSKDRFMEEVWRGVPVTDEALTQCIRSLRRALGDDASAPRFIETVPKHGYRFIATIDRATGDERQLPEELPGIESRWTRAGWIAGGTTIAGALAGAGGGLLYGAIAAADAQDAGVGAASVLLVMTALSVAIGTLGGAGVGIGMALARVSAGPGSVPLIAGGAVGGMVIGALGKLLSLDGVILLTGIAPGSVTGLSEGLALGAVCGVMAWLTLSRQAWSIPRALAAGLTAGAGIGLVIQALGGRLMAGSLSLLHDRFPQSNLHVARIGEIFGESDLGPVSLFAASALEAAVFVGCVAGVLTWLRGRIA